MVQIENVADIFRVVVLPSPPKEWTNQLKLAYKDYDSFVDFFARTDPYLLGTAENERYNRNFDLTDTVFPVNGTMIPAKRSLFKIEHSKEKNLKNVWIVDGKTRHLNFGYLYTLMTNIITPKGEGYDFFPIPYSGVNYRNIECDIDVTSCWTEKRLRRYCVLCAKYIHYIKHAAENEHGLRFTGSEYEGVLRHWSAYLYAFALVLSIPGFKFQVQYNQLPYVLKTLDSENIPVILSSGLETPADYHHATLTTYGVGSSARSEFDRIQQDRLLKLNQEQGNKTTMT